MTVFTWDQVLAFHQDQHFLLHRAKRSEIIDVVRRICGLHAQVMSSAELALRSRLDDLAPDDVSKALWQDRRLVKTWAMRGTLHLIPADDYALLAGALRAFKHFRRASWLKYHGVTMDELDAILTSAPKVLGGEGLTREQLADALAEQTGQTKLRELMKSGWGMLLKPVAFQGDLCFGPNQGQNVTFVSPSAWLGSLPDVDTQEALREMLRRYLRAYGPATLDDFCRWWGMEESDAKKLFRSLGDEVVPVSVEGRDAVALAETVELIKRAEAPPIVRLLPGFDPYVVGLWRDCEAVLPASHKARVFRPQGWISPVVLVGGRVAGVWDYETKRGRGKVTVDLFSDAYGDLCTGLDAEVQRLASYEKAELDLVIEN